MAVRTFLALPLDEVIVRRLTEAQRSLSSAGARVRWVALENLHLTVKFLGDVIDEDLDKVCRTAEEIASQTQPFEFSIKGLSSVPPAGQMRMVWAGVDEPTGRLEKMHSIMEEAYARLGFRAENRAYRPHLTLGRVKSGQNVAQLRAAVGRYAETDFGVQSAEELIVFSSQLTPKGPVYSPLKQASLG
jgi:2'-5' RNA ligase